MSQASWQMVSENQLVTGRSVSASSFYSALANLMVPLS